MGGDARRAPDTDAQAADAQAADAKTADAQATERKAHDEGYDESAASSGPNGEDVREYQQDKAEGGAAQGGKGRVE